MPVSPSYTSFIANDTADIPKLGFMTWAAAVEAAIVTSPEPTLTANRTYYVRTDGNNANNGLVDSATGAFQSIQKAVDVAASVDASTFNVTVLVRAGTYTAAVGLRGLRGTGVLTLQGDTTTPSNVVVSVTGGNCFAASNTQGVVLTGFKTITTTGGNHIFADALSDISVGRWEFGAAAAGSSHVESWGGSRVSFTANYTISGGGAVHLHAAYAGRITNAAVITVTVTGTPAFTTAFAWAEQLSYLQFWFNTISGGATGTRYVASQNSVVQTGGGGASYFPGSAAGNVNTGGLYL